MSNPSSHLQSASLSFLSRATLWALAASAVFGSRSAAQQLEPEEAGYLAEQGALIAATCRVGTTVPVPSMMPNAYGGGDLVYRYVDIWELEGAYSVVGAIRIDWRRMYLATEQLLAPRSLEPLRAALLSAIQAQASLAQARDNQRGIVFGRIRSASALACSRHAAFRQSIARRPRISSSASWSITYTPPVLPVGVSVNSTGEFSLSVSHTIGTPFGSVTLAAAESYGRPRRLIIRNGRTQRVLFLDRPFKVFVPTDYGVNVINTGRDLILEVVPRPSQRR